MACVNGITAVQVCVQPSTLEAFVLHALMRFIFHNQINKDDNNGKKRMIIISFDIFFKKLYFNINYTSVFINFLKKLQVENVCVYIYKGNYKKSIV